MTTHVCRKYPSHTKAIRALRDTDASFNEMCNEYEEMCTWLVAQNCSTDSLSEECIDAREIIRDLEAEIKTALMEAGYQIGTQEQVANK